MRNKQELGRRGEEAAAEFLATQGFEVLERNCRVHYGELDLICRDGDQLVFCEVKTRFGSGGILPEEMFDYKKEQKLRRSVGRYLASRRVRYENYRVDLLAVQYCRESDEFEVRHYPAIC